MFRQPPSSLFLLHRGAACRCFRLCQHSSSASIDTRLRLCRYPPPPLPVLRLRICGYPASASVGTPPPLLPLPRLRLCRTPPVPLPRPASLIRQRDRLVIHLLTAGGLRLSEKTERRAGPEGYIGRGPHVLPGRLSGRQRYAECLGLTPGVFVGGKVSSWADLASPTGTRHAHIYMVDGFVDTYSRCGTSFPSTAERI